MFQLKSYTSTKADMYTLFTPNENKCQKNMFGCQQMREDGTKLSVFGHKIVKIASISPNVRNI